MVYSILILVFLVFHCISIGKKVVSGNVASYNYDAGLFHLTGLVHVSEVSWDLVQDVRDILSEGDEVRVKVISVDRLVCSTSFLIFTIFSFN